MIVPRSGGRADTFRDVFRFTFAHWGRQKPLVLAIAGLLDNTIEVLQRELAAETDAPSTTSTIDVSSTSRYRVPHQLDACRYRPPHQCWGS